MYFIKLNNKKVTRTAIKGSFSTYESARTALRKFLLSSGQIDLTGGFGKLGYSISKVK